LSEIKKILLRKRKYCLYPTFKSSQRPPL